MIRRGVIIAAMVAVLIAGAFFGVMLSKPIPAGTPSATAVPTPKGLPSSATLIPIASPSFATTIPSPGEKPRSADAYPFRTANAHTRVNRHSNCCPDLE